jgi:hypothetical protein
LTRRSCGRRKPSTNKEAVVEETIGYEALFSPDEWDAIHSGDYPDLDNEFSSGVAAPVPGRVVPSPLVAPEDPLLETPVHRVEISEYGGYDDGAQAFVLCCEVCDEIGGADTTEEALAIQRLHEEFVAVLVAQWEVG